MSRKPRSRRTADQRPNRTILSRTLVLMSVCGIVAFIVLAAKLFQVQILQHDHYEQLAVEQQTRDTTVTAARGTIYDTNGKVLAMSASVETVYISPHEMKQYNEDANLIASNLSQILGVDKDDILQKAQDSSSWYKVIKPKIESGLADQVRQFINQYSLKSIHLETDTKRYYPYSSLACHVIGFVGTDNSGLGGIEAEYNKSLSGTNGRIVRLKNANGTDLLYNDFENYYDAKDGSNITLTIDSTIQYYVEKYLAQAIKDYDIQNGGCCIAMRPKTGEILGMATYGNYDLNDYMALNAQEQEKLSSITDKDEYAKELKQALYDQWRNRAISDTYEPGSVFKIITLSMALEEGVVNMNSTFYCGGSMNVLGRTDPLRCWKSAGHGLQTLSEAVQNSCNVALATIGLRVGAETFYKYIDAFGFFDETGIDLPGESGSIWWPEKDFTNKNDLSSLAAASFGQTFNITPIQLITAISAVANGGNLMKPYVVKQITDADGNVTQANQPTVVRQVISEQTSKTVCSILQDVVSKGTGKNAYVAGYRVGGKTGTSEKVAQDAATGKKQYIVSFCGMAPTDDPQVVVLLLLDNPSDKTGLYISGGNMAAPVVGNILSEVLPYLGVQPEYTADELKSLEVTVPKLTSESVEQAKADIDGKGLTVRVVGDGDTVTDQLPAANALVANGTEVILYAGGQKPDNTVTVPNLYGKTYSEAKNALEKVGLYLRSTGASPSASGTAVSTQSVTNGNTVPYGSVIEVTLVDQTNLGRY